MKIIYKGGRRNIDPDIFFPAPPWALNELISNIEKAWNPKAILKEIESYLNIRIAEEAKLFEEYRKGYIEQLTKRGPDFEQIETSTLLKRREIERLKENRKRVKERKNFKLRAWDKKAKEMLNVALIDLRDSIIYNAKNENFIGSYIKKGLYSPDGFLDIDRLIFMQYTRLKDVDGTEIYEGDILEANFIFEEVDGSSYLETVNAKVYFNEANGAWEVEEYNGETDPLGDWISNGNAKVVGSIFEATEVVEVEIGGGN